MIVQAEGGVNAARTEWLRALAKLCRESIGGYGLPLALLLVRPELDVWRPGAHSGTFRGVNPAFVTATEALRTYWMDGVLDWWRPPAHGTRW